MMRQRGFSLIELIVVIVIAGTLAVFAAARYQGQDSLESFGARDELASAFRMAQQYAVTSGCETQVTVTANSYTVLLENAPCGSGAPVFGTTISSPTGSGSLNGSFSDMTISPTGMHRYDAYGDLSSGGGTLTVTSGSDSASFIVQTGSGFVDLP